MQQRRADHRRAAGAGTQPDHRSAGQCIVAAGRADQRCISAAKNGPGPLLLAGANSYGGKTILDAGTLFLAHDNALGAGAIELNGGTVAAATTPRLITNQISKLANNIVFDGRAQRLAFLTDLQLHKLGNRTIVVEGDVTFNRISDPTYGKNLRLRGSGDFHYNLSSSGTNVGAHIYNTGEGALYVYGAGTVGAISYYSGSGGLIAVGDRRDPSSGAIERGIGSLRIRGNGRGLELSTPGITVEMALAASANDRIVLEDNGGRNADTDIVLADPTTNPAGATLKLTAEPDFSPNPNQVFVLIEHLGSGSGTIVGTFRDLPHGALIDLAGGMVINYGAKQVTLTNRPSLLFEVVAGDTQTSDAGAAFAEPLQVRVLNSLGEAVPNVLVVFTSPESGAAATFPSGNQAVSDSNGLVSIPVGANPIGGSYRVRAHTFPYETTEIEFTLTNLAPEPTATATPICI
ncbi:MAG: hypothetical protein HC822_27995 [Oscillochloris sp.]|nr:hypothetical protein [Oscillochloris sp.]